MVVSKDHYSWNFFPQEGIKRNITAALTDTEIGYKKRREPLLPARLPNQSYIIV
jgi:hypothetical protein